MSKSPPPLNDCRITLRCLKQDVGLRLPLDKPFASLRSENSLVDAFFERRENDGDGGEGGERILAIKSRPAFSLHSGRTRAATWFDRGNPHGPVVWLLGAELHDERHKGKADAYDIFGQRDAANELFPKEVDYKRQELDQRRLDTENFADDVREHALALVRECLGSGTSRLPLVGIPTRCRIDRGSDELQTFTVAVSRKPVAGARSGLEFPLTDDRFLLLAEAVRQAAESILGPEVLIEEVHVFPDGRKLMNERAFVMIHGPV